jgi:alpha-tubulin suppressor-like RCC1 family protein
MLLVLLMLMVVLIFLVGGLVAISAKVSDLTSGRVTYAGGSGELQDNAGLTFDGTTLAATRLAAPVAFTTSLTAANVDVTGITTIRDDLTLKGAAANITFDKSTDDLIFDDNAEAKFGTGGDLRVYHSGSKSYIKDAGTGSLRINSDDFRIYNAADSEYMLQAVENGAVTLYFDSSAKINTTSVGVNVVGNVDCDSINNAGITTFTGAATLNGNTTFGADVTFGGASSATALVWDKSVDDLIFADGAQAKFGTGGDLSIYSNGSDSFFASNTGNIDFRTTNAGSINLRADDKYGIYIQNSGTVRLYHDNSAKIETTSVGVNVTGNVDCDSLNNAGISTFTGSISLPDSSGSTVGRVRIGNSQDLQIYHSSYSYLSESSGRLYLQSNRLYVQSASGENMIYAEGDAGVNLYHNASSRLATTNAGVTVTGTVAATSYTGDGSSLTGVGASTAPMAYNPPVSSTRPATVGVALTFNQQVKAGSGNINLRQVSTSGTITQAFTVTDATEVAFAQSDLREMSLLGVNELLPDSVYCIDIPASAIDDSTGSYVGTAYTFYTQSASLNMMAWGRNNVGQLAQGASASDSDKASRSSPIQIADGSSTWKYVPHGHTEDAYNAGAIKADNTLWTWGYNQDGVLGQNQAAAQFQETASPVQVPGTNWNGLNCSVNQNWWLATKTDGTMWTWGRNSHGQLGQGNRTSYSSPNQLPGTTWSSTSQGFMNCGNYYTSYATKTDGTLWSWGLADNGSLGQGPAASCSSPKQIPGTTWKEVAAAQQAGAAIKTDGTLFVWGNGTNGQMGNGGTTASNPSPIQVPGTTWTQISGMSQGWVATKTDGTIWTWGRNEQGQLGLNNRTDKSSPEQVGSGTDWISAHSNRNNACIAVKTDGTLWMWGAGDEGLTGINKSAPTGGTVSSPVQIPGKWTNTTSAPAQNGVRPHQIGVQGSYAMALEYDLGG